MGKKQLDLHQEDGIGRVPMTPRGPRDDGLGRVPMPPVGMVPMSARSVTPTTIGPPASARSGTYYRAAEMGVRENSDLSSMPPTSARSLKANKIQPRNMSPQPGPAADPSLAGAARPLKDEKRHDSDLRLLRQLSKDIQDHVCQNMRVVVREELQAILEPQLGSLSLGGGQDKLRQSEPSTTMPLLRAAPSSQQLEFRTKSQAADVLLHGRHGEDLLQMSRDNIVAINRRPSQEKDDTGAYMDLDEEPAVELRQHTNTSSMFQGNWMEKSVAVHRRDVFKDSGRLNLLDRVTRKVPMIKPCIEWCGRVHDWFNSLEEPPRNSMMARWVNSNTFEMLSFIGIGLNCMFMIYSADYEIDNYMTTEKTEFIKTAESTFLVWFGIELGLKVWVHGKYFYVSVNWKMRCLDTFLILFHFWSVLGNYGVLSSQANLSFMRAIRMLRLLRVVRALKAMHHFKQLHAILTAIQTSMLTLLWSMLMVAGILWMFSLLFVQRTTAYFMEMYETAEGLDPNTEQNLRDTFGSVWSAMLSLFMATSGGDDWSKYYGALEPTGVSNQIMYLLFIAFMQFAVLNIVTGIFVETAMKQMEKDAEEAAMDFLKSRHQKEQDLLHMCEAADKDGNGCLSQEEFVEAIKQGRMTAFLDHLGFQHQDVLDFFDVLASTAPDKRVDIRIFVSGCMKLTGGATRYDMKAMMMEVKAIHAGLAELRLCVIGEQAQQKHSIRSAQLSGE